VTKTEKAANSDFRFATSPDGFRMFVLQSWLQKSIRRGEEKDALYAAQQLSKSGFDGAVFNILVTVSSEDIGLAERGLLSEVINLRSAFQIEKARNSKHHPQRLQLVHAVLLCVRAKKSRLVDHATIVAYEAQEKREPPEWVLDMHTAQGKAQGKGVDDFFTDGAKLINEADILDPYRDEAQKIRKAAEKVGKAA
jgi:replication-associated recombination protein RarA